MSVYKDFRYEKSNQRVAVQQPDGVHFFPMWDIKAKVFVPPNAISDKIEGEVILAMALTEENARFITIQLQRVNLGY